METDTLQWKQWQNVPYVKSGIMKNRMGDKEHSGNLSYLVGKYMEQLNTMSIHQFNKIYQVKQFNICLQSLRKGQVLLVHNLFPKSTPLHTK